MGDVEGGSLVVVVMAVGCYRSGGGGRTVDVRKLEEGGQPDKPC
jgi:hypothetical protein